MKYEYKVSIYVTHDPIELENLLDEKNWLDEKGIQGWKLINVKDSKYIFIRDM